MAPPKRGLDINIDIINDRPVPKNVEPCTEADYIRQLQNWDDFIAAHGPRSVDCLKDLKEFVYRLGFSMRAKKQPHETLAAEGLKSYWKKFTAGYQRERGPIPAENIIMITRLIEPRGAIGKALNIVPDAGPRKHATGAVLAWVGEYLWSLDWKVLSRPRTRIDIWSVLLLAAYTCARVSDYIESTCRYGTNIGLHYKDTTLILFHNEHGRSELALQSTKFLKGHHHLSSKLPTPHIHEGGAFDRQPLFMNPMVFLLAIFCSKGALRDYQGNEGLSRLLDLEVGPEQAQILIHWSPKVLNQPIFTGASGRILTADVFSKELRALQIRAGFPEPPGLHCFRAEGLTNVDYNPMYSDTQRQRLAGHENNQIHQQHYASRNPGVDSQAMYLGLQARGIDIGKFFRNLEVRWEPALWQSLPAVQKLELEKTKSYQTKAAKLSALLSNKAGHTREVGLGATQSNSDNQDLSPSDPDEVLICPDRKVKRELRNMEQKALQTVWNETSQRVHVGSQNYVCKGVNHPFSRLRPVLPLRGRLADILITDASLRSPIGKEALMALVALYSSSKEVVRRGLDLRNCLCRAPAPTQSHVYQCKKENSTFADFCFFCNQWFSDPDVWEEHCRYHLGQGDLPVELAWEKIGTTFLPGYCPFCLWDSCLPASRRLRQFGSQCEWEGHIYTHGVTWLSQCPDKRCTESYDAQSFSHHMYDVHRIPLGTFGVDRKLKREANGELEGGSPAKKSVKYEFVKYEFVPDEGNVVGTEVSSSVVT